MPQKKHKPEEIVAKLRQVDVLVSQGRSVAEAVRSIGVTQFTYYRWRKEYGGLKTDQVKRLKELEKENERLRKAVSDLTLEKLILRGERCAPSVRAPARTPRETSEPRPPSCLCRSRQAEVQGVGTVRLSRAGPASLDPAEGRRAGAPMRRRSPRTSSRSPPSMAATATGGSRLCCGRRAGP